MLPLLGFPFPVEILLFKWEAENRKRVNGEGANKLAHSRNGCRVCLIRTIIVSFTHYDYDGIVMYRCALIFVPQEKR